MLRELTKAAPVADTQRVTATKPPGAAPVETKEGAVDSEQITKNVLDKLTGQSTPETRTQPVEQDDQPRGGEPGHA